MKKRVFLIGLISVLALSTITGAFADTSSSAEENEQKNYQEANVTSIKEMKNLEKVDVIKVKGDIVLRANLEEMENMLDNSKVCVIENVNQQELAELAEKTYANYSAVELAEGQRTIGAVLTRDDSGNNKVTEVIAEVADQLVEGKIIRTDNNVEVQFLDWLEENATLDIDGIYSDFELSKQENSSRTVSSSFGDVSAFRYLYTAPDENDRVEYVKNADSSRYLLATTKVVLYGYKAKTSGTTTYDSFKAEVYVNPKNDLKVHTFNVNLYTTENSRYDVLGATEIESDSSSSSSRSVSVTLPADVASVSGSLTHTYSYKTGGKEVTNKLFLTQYKHRWVAKPINPAKEASYNIKPGMVVKATNGTEKQNLAMASLSYLKLKKVASAYWITDKDVIVNLYYKNHIQV